MKLGVFTSQSCSDSREMCKNWAERAKILLWLLKLILFWRSFLCACVCVANRLQPYFLSNMTQHFIWYPNTWKCERKSQLLAFSSLYLVIVEKLFSYDIHTLEISIQFSKIIEAIHKYLSSLIIFIFLLKPRAATAIRRAQMNINSVFHFVDYIF